MPINVAHDDDKNSQIALSLLTALLQPQQNQIPAPQQQSPSSPSDLLNQLAPLTAARANGSAPQNPYAVNGDASAPSYQSRPSRRVPSYANYDGLYGGGSSGSSNSDAKYANQDELAQFRAKQSDQRLHERDQQQSDMEVQRQLAEPEHDIPQYIQEGLNSGRYRYDPANRRKRSEAENGITQAINDPTWSAPQKSQLIAKLKNQIRQYDLSVQDVPFNERPVPPDQAYQAQQIIRPVPVDENTTLNLPVVPYTRNGETRYELAPEGKAQLDIALLKSKQQHAMQLKQMELDAKAQAEANKPPKETPEQRRAREVDTAEMHAQMTNNFKRITDAQARLEELHTARVKAQAAFNSASKTAGAPSDDTALTAATEAEKQAQQRLQDLEQEHENYKNQAKALTDQAASAAMDSGQPPDQTMEQPAAQQALPVSSPDDLRQQIRSGQLQSGDTVMTPSGPHQLTDDDISGA